MTKSYRLTLAAVAIAALFTACTTDTTIDGSNVKVDFVVFTDSDSIDRREPTPLNGATISGIVEVLVNAGEEVDHVSFFLDDASQDKLPFAEAKTFPFSAVLDSQDLGKGMHTLTLVVDYSGAGRSSTVKSVSFIVDNTIEPAPGANPSEPVPEEPQPEEPGEPDEPFEPDEPEAPPGDTPPDDPGVEYPSPTLWVSTSGSDSNDGRSSETAFRTIERAARVVRPGDVVYIKGGTYQEYLGAELWTRSGLPDMPITIMGAPGETVVLDGSQRTNDGSHPSHPKLIWLRDTDWYVFRNLTLKSSAGRGIALEGDHHVIRDLVVLGSHAEGVWIRGSFNLIEDVISAENYTYSNEGESADGFKVDSGENNVLRRVLAYDNSDDGIDLWDSTSTLVEYSAAFRNGRGSNGDGMGFKMSNGSRANANSTIRYNVSFNNRGYNFTDNGGGGLTLYHNTSFESGFGRGFVARGRLGQTRHVLYNNLSFDRNGVMVNVQSGSTLPLQQANSWNLGISEPGFMSTDPSSQEFLRLAPDSPAIDAGRDLGLEYEGAAPDLGAHEYGLNALLAQGNR